MGGEFATIYLSPKDYHRVHMPLAGTLREMVYVPGRLFSVNQTTAENVPSCSPATSVWSACSTPSVGRWRWCWLAR
jgi:phosphatidylserine decarboxylase